MKRDRFTKMYIFVLFVLIAILSIITPVHASFSIDRQLIELEVVPGKRITGEIGLTNKLDKEQTIQIRAVDYTRDNMGNVNTPEAGTTEYSLYPYIEFSTSLITLKSGESTRISYTIYIPEGVVGSRWIALYFEPVDGVSQTEGTGDEADGVVLQNAQFNFIFKVRYRTLILVNIKGTEDPNGKVIGLKRIDGKGTAFEIDVENTGNSYYRAEGWLEIRDTKGSTVATIPVNRSFILPDQILKITAADDTLKLAPGKYLALAVIDYGGDRLVAGQLVFTVEY